MIVATDLRVRFGAVQALDGLTLHVPDGSLFGLLGPNGAGKTTAIACLAGLRSPDSGKVCIDGIDVAAEPQRVRPVVGLVPQELAVYPELRVADNLRVLGGLHGLRGRRLRERVDQALSLAQLEARASERIGRLSGGMKRRLSVACSLLHDPKLVIFDEPTTGVDPQSRHHIYETIRALHAEGRTIVYTTHHLEEVEALCDRAAIVDAGRVVAEGTLAALMAPAGRPKQHVVELSADLDPAEVEAALRAQGIEPRSVTAATRSLEDVFLELTGHSLRDGS